MTRRDRRVQLAGVRDRVRLRERPERLVALAGLLLLGFSPAVHDASRGDRTCVIVRDRDLREQGPGRAEPYGGRRSERAIEMDVTPAEHVPGRLERTRGEASGEHAVDGAGARQDDLRDADRRGRRERWIGLFVEVLAPAPELAGMDTAGVQDARGDARPHVQRWHRDGAGRSAVVLHVDTPELAVGVTAPAQELARRDPTGMSAGATTAAAGRDQRWAGGIDRRSVEWRIDRHPFERRIDRSVIAASGERWFREARCKQRA